MVRRIVVFLVIGLILAACGGDGGSTAADSTATAVTPSSTEATTVSDSTVASPSSTATTLATVEVAQDLSYRSSTEDPNEVDVYYRPEEGGPLVVLFHGGGADKSFPLYPPLASALVEQGAVVFVPDWDASFTGDLEVMTEAHDGAGCAVAFARSEAAEFGGDADRLVLVGHSAGASPAQWTGLHELGEVDDCGVEPTPIDADGIVLWDGDLMLGGLGTDPYLDQLPDLMEVGTVWSWLETAPKTPTVLVTTAGGASSLKRCGVSDPGDSFWERDPDGWFYPRFEASGALEDGCVDIGEVADLLAVTMREHGFEVTELLLEDSSHIYLDDHDQTLLIEQIITLTER